MSATRSGLLRRSVALAVLVVAVVGALFVAYTEVHGDAAPLREDTAPAILDVTAAQNALIEANKIVEDTTAQAQGELVDTGGSYRVQISVANQSLARAAEASVRGESGLRQLETVTGLIVYFAGWLEKADQEPVDTPLREAYEYYADQMLTKNDDGILDRLDELQEEQNDVLARQAAFDWPSRLVWAAALLLGAALLVLLVETQFRFLRRRFRRRLNAGLLVATAMVLAVLGVLTVVTVQTQNAKAATRDQLDQELIDPWKPLSVAKEAFINPDDVSESVRRAAARVDAEMSGTDRWDGLAGPIPLLGLLIAAPGALGLWPRIDQYRFRRVQ